MRSVAITSRAPDSYSTTIFSLTFGGVRQFTSCMPKTSRVGELYQPLPSTMPTALLPAASRSVTS